MWLLMKTAWRNLFRQRRRTLITVTAMAFSLAVAIPFNGLVLGVRAQVVRGITGMETGHLQVHDPAYVRGRALQSTLRRPGELLARVRRVRGVKVAAARVHGYGLLSSDRRLTLRRATPEDVQAALQEGAVRFGRGIDPRAPWRADVARACEALVGPSAVTGGEVGVGTVLSPASTRGGRRCERVRVVGVLRAPLRATRSGGELVLVLPRQDARRVFTTRPSVEAVVRGAAPVSITGVQPDLERRITFMKDTVRQGRYLADAICRDPRKAAHEILVGYRLAKTLKLTVGSRVFLQASSLDVSAGEFYARFRVVGIFKTGVEGIDRTRVFLHLGDAQRLMGLGDQVHEIVIKAGDPHHLAGVKARIARQLAQGGLKVQRVPTGKRGGVSPLRGAMVVVALHGGDVGLLQPEGLSRRLESIKGLAAVARRVYARTVVRLARRVTTRITRVERETWAKRVGKPPADPCVIYASAAWVRAHGLTVGQRLILQGAEDGTCQVARIAALSADARPPKPGRREPPGSTAHGGVLALAPPESDADALALEIPAGKVTLLVPESRRTLPLVGLEAGLESRLPAFANRLAAGRFPDSAKDRAAGVVGAMLTERSAKALGATLGAELLVRAKDEDGRVGWRSVRLVGLLSGGAAGGPALVLPYFEAQQVDARRLNARAHELVLIPSRGAGGSSADPAALARAVAAHLRPVVRTWDEINPGMKEVAQMQDTFMGILAFIIFAIAAMTVMNTMLMAVFERTREFGVLKSLGMRPRQVFGLILFETLFLALLAVAVGGSLGAALDHYLSVQGLDLSGLYGGVEVQGTFIDPRWKAVLSLRGILVPMYLTAVVCLLVSLYPALRAGRLKPVQAMRQHR